MIEYSSEKEFLDAYNIHDYDIPLTSVDMAIFTIIERQLQVLLVKRAQYPCKGKWALPGGFINLNSDKSLEDTAFRKLYEKTGVRLPYLEQVETFGSANRDPRGWSVTVAYMALISAEEIRLAHNETSEDIKWIPITDVKSQIKLAFDHQIILDACYTRLKNKVQYTSLPINLLPDEFTLTELQQTFEIILGQSVEKKSFRRRILDAEILQETGKMKTGNSRPAKLYKGAPDSEAYFFPRSIEGKR